VLIETDPDARTWTIHELDASDQEAVREAARRMYEQYQKAVWP
jgi:multisubunit Na+/H+ antiporter MnhE subunit